ncbi:MAG: hypothetical protein H6Q66_1882 [Firmicutes bacterium]|nr:hypothetical protein [Bacillota bacterium]
MFAFMPGKQYGAASPWSLSANVACGEIVLAQKGDISMDIYTYFFFSYGLTAIIAFSTVLIILFANKIMQAFERSLSK